MSEAAVPVPVPSHPEAPAATLSVCGVSKRFGGLHALRGVDLQVNRGEVVGLVGDNGAGKSTLMKIIAGVRQPTTGHIAVDGEIRRFSQPSDAVAAGISTVYQDLALAMERDVVANFFLGRELVRPGFLGSRLGRLDRGEMRRRTGQEQAAMAAADAPLLEIPDNYHEDLQARFDLDDATVARLRDAAMLYDRDEVHGEFLHFYTAPLGPRLFLEFVQRIGSYNGYGAPNAAVRLAAHAEPPRSARPVRRRV